MAFNAATMYQNRSVQTASPAGIVLMLLEGAIKFSNRAIIGIEKKDFEMTHTNLIKTQRIITELNASLDESYPVSKDFERVYTQINSILAEANVKKDQELIEQALGYIREMRDTWKQVMELTKTAR